MSIAYLCGHLHTLGGLVPQMYTMQDEGFAELELADWKDGRMLVISRLIISTFFEILDHICKLKEFTILTEIKSFNIYFYKRDSMYNNIASDKINTV